MKNLKVLLVWPPCVPSYFNAGHRLSVFMAARHLRSVDARLSVRAVDAAALNGTWKSFGDLLFEGWDVVGFANDLDGIDGMEKAVRYARELSPGAKLLTFGRLSQMVPDLFCRFDLDGIVGSGDPEAGVEQFILHIDDLSADVPGLWLRDHEVWRAPARPGLRLAADALPLPDLDDVPTGAYCALGRRDADRFAGVPGKRELVVPVARGCPVGCTFCDVPALQGRRERRLTVDHVVVYIDEAFSSGRYDYVSFYAPTFTLRRDWVLELSARLESLGGVPWKCATTLRHLDAQLIGRMAASGCVRISVGVETLSEAEASNLPRLKLSGNSSLHDVASWCHEAGVELNCFVIVGLPGSSLASVARTIQVLEDLGVHVRPTAYSPYHEMHAGLSTSDVSRYNRQSIFGEWSADDRAGLYRFVFAEHGAREVASDLIARRRPPPVPDQERDDQPRLVRR